MAEEDSLDGCEIYSIQAKANFQGIDRAGDPDIAIAQRAQSSHPRVNAGSVPFAAWDAGKLAALLKGVQGEFRSLRLVTTTRRTILPGQDITMKGIIRFKRNRGPSGTHRQLFGTFLCDYCEKDGGVLAITECDFIIERETADHGDRKDTTSDHDFEI